MPTMASIVLNDAQTTPVAHTFLPMSLRNDIGSYQDNASGTVVTWPTITISARPASSTNAGHKTTLKLVFPHAPILDPSDPYCCVPQGSALPSSSFTVEITRSNAASAADFATVLKYLQEVVLDNQFTKTAAGESLR